MGHSLCIMMIMKDSFKKPPCNFKPRILIFEKWNVLKIVLEMLGLSNHDKVNWEVLKGMWSEWTTLAKIMPIILETANMFLNFCCFLAVNKNMKINNKISTIICIGFWSSKPFDIVSFFSSQLKCLLASILLQLFILVALLIKQQYCL